MRKTIFAAVLGASLISGLALAEESKPIKLTAEQMDSITAGELTLPTPFPKAVFDGFDNPAPQPFHPSFFRSTTATTQQTANGYSGPIVTEPFNEGPWSATVAGNTPIVCTQAPC